MGDESPYQITISETNAPASVNEGALRRAIEAALLHHNVPAAEIDVAIVADAEIERLNQAYLNHSGPTDVLTFDLRDSSDTPEVEGQIVLSIDTARREAAARGHSPDAEVALYAVHGLLHLLGYHDDTEARASIMHDLEDQILAKAGLSPTFCIKTRPAS